MILPQKIAQFWLLNMRQTPKIVSRMESCQSTMLPIISGFKPIVSNNYNFMSIRYKTSKNGDSDLTGDLFKETKVKNISKKISAAVVQNPGLFNSDDKKANNVTTTNDVEDKKRPKCPHCNKILCSPSYIKIHIATVHEKQKKICMH